LRGALDHLAYALADWRTQGSIRNPNVIQFPICDGSDDFWRDKANRYLSEVHPLHVAVVERFQAYQAIKLFPTGGPEGIQPFRLLRNLSNTDKHRLLNVVVIPTNVTMTDIDVLGGLSSLKAGRAYWGQTAELGTEVYRVTRPDRLPDMEMIGSVLSSVTLSEVPTYSLTSTTAGLEWNVSHILNLFEPLSR
jgi:hypothetical protein